MHFCEMRDTPHLTNEYEIEIESKNKIKQRQRRRHRNNNNQNVAPASSSEQLKIRSKMRQPAAAAPLSGTVGSSVMRQLPQLQLQLPLLLLLCAGLNGLTHVAALKGKLQLHLCTFPPPLSPLLRALGNVLEENMINHFRALLMANKSFVEMQLWLALLRYLLVSFVVLPFSHCLPHLVVPRFGYFWLQPTALFLFMRRVR